MLSKKLSRSFLGLIRSPLLKPSPGVQKAVDSDFDWSCSHDDPQFKFSTKAWLPGWYMLELSVEHEKASATSSIYLNTGNGFNEQQRLDLPLRQEKLTKRLIYIPASTRTIRLDPLNSKGLFSVHVCRFVWLTPMFARRKLFTRLSNMHPKLLNLSRTALIAELKRLAQEEGVNWKKLALDYYDEMFFHCKPEENYSRWLKHVEPKKHLSTQEVRSARDLFASKPLISIILPVYNTDPEWLRACIYSVISQSYSNWQLCIADDASTRPDTREALNELVVTDSRIEIAWRAQNGHISAASNSALELVKGEFVALLDHDDKLAVNALFHVVEAINHNPGATLIYSDEDKIDDSDNRYGPYFKAGWNPDLLYSQNYICHLAVYKTERVRDIGGFREGFEGSQDHDLVLRFTKGVPSSQIVHIPRILYHWRAIEGSTALNSSEKEYTESAGLSSVRSFLSQSEPKASVLPGLVDNSYRVRWPLPDVLPLVSLLVPTRDGVEILRPCVDKILELTDYDNFELIILDNQSSCTETLSYMQAVEERDNRVRVLSWDKPFNYSAINNFGASKARGTIIGLVNNDIEPINTEWLSEMVSQVCRNEIGCVGAKLYYPNETVQHAGVILGIGGVAGHSHKYFSRGSSGYFSRLKLVQNLSAITAACLIVRKSVYDEVGGLNEDHLTVAFNDVDFCLKVREAGYRNLWTPYAELYHHESVSRGGDDNPKKRARAQKEVEYMRKTWGDKLDNDPAYNVNLSLAYEDFSLG